MKLCFLFCSQLIKVKKALKINFKTKKYRSVFLFLSSGLYRWYGVPTHSALTRRARGLAAYAYHRQ